MKIRKRMVANVLAVVMAVSTFQLPMGSVRAEELIQETEDMDVMEEDVGAGLESRYEDAADSESEDSEEKESAMEDTESEEEEEVSDPENAENESGIEEPVADNVEVEEQESKSDVEDMEDEIQEEIAVESDGETVLIFSDDDIANGIIDEDYGYIEWVIDAGGKLTVKGTGDFSTSAGYKRAPWNSYSSEINSAEVDVKGMTDASYMFYGCNRVSSMDLSNLDTSNVINMGEMFGYCSSLSSLDLSSFDTGNVTDMSGMFEGCGCLSSLNVSSFDTGNVTDMSGMFRECYSLRGLDLGSFDMINVTDMGGMFDGCSRLSYIITPKNCPENRANELPGNHSTDRWHDAEDNTYEALPTGLDYSITLYKNDYSGDGTFGEIIDSGTINNITWTIDKDGLLTITGTGDYRRIYDSYVIDTPPWAYKGSSDISSIVKTAVVNVTDITSTKDMFSGCWLLTSINWENLDTGEVKDMSGMFGGCPGLSSLDLSSFDTSNVTDMSDMFSGCTGLSSLDVNSFDTSNVTSMDGMFWHCSSLTSLDLSSFNTSSVTRMDGIFGDCSSLTSLDLSSFNTSSSVTRMDQMFMGCSSLVSLDLSSFNTSSVTRMDDMFMGCSSLVSMNLSSFNTGNVKNAEGMFSGCSRLTSLDLSNFNTQNITNMYEMFCDCKSLTNLNLSGFDTANVTTMDGMFSGCSRLTNLDLSSFNTGNVKNMRGMFSDCSRLTSLDLSSFDTSYVSYMDFMFSDCSGLKSLDLSSFDTNRVTDVECMFLNCSNLTSLDLSSFDLSEPPYAMSVYAMFDGCTNLNIIYTPYNLQREVELPGSWYKPNGIKIKILPQNLNYSIIIAKSEIPVIAEPYIKVAKRKTIYECGDILNTDDLTVTFYNNDGTVVKVKDYTTNINEIDMSLSGTKVLVITYNDLAATVELTVEGTEDDKQKQAVTISGITIEGKVYDGKPNTYTGAAIVKDPEGNEIPDVSLRYSYTGTLADSSAYAETTEAPSQAGSYTLSVAVTGNDTYTGQVSYDFTIGKKELSITAPSVSIKIGEQLPDLSKLAYTVDGLVEADKLITEPSFKYSAENISTTAAGSYEIIPYDADAGNNYNIKFVNGIFTIAESGDNPPSGGENDDPSGDIGDNPYYVDFGDDTDYDNTERTDLNDIGSAIATIKAKTYDGIRYEPTLKVTVKNEKGKKVTLTEGTDYRVLYSDNLNAGTGTVTVKGNGIYKGSLTAAFTIKPKSIKKLKVVAGSMSVIGGDIVESELPEVPVCVYDGTALIKPGEGYTLSHTSAQVAGTASKGFKVTLTGTGNYTGTVTAKIAVYGAGINMINPDNVILADENGGVYKTPYTGKAIKNIKPTVMVGGTPLTEKKDYKLSYKNNKDAGTAFVIVTGKGTYKGTVVVPFEITANEGTLTLTKAITDKTYNGKLQKPTVTVKSGRNKLKKNKDYTIYYKSNLHAGTATVVVTGKGNYAGQNGVWTFRINPQKISKVAVKGTQIDGLTVTYAKRLLKLGSDYTIQYGETKGKKVKVTINAIEGEGRDFKDSVTKSVKIK